MCHQTVSLVARHLEENGIPTVVMAAARDIPEHVGVARLLHSDFPLGSPCGEPNNGPQQKEILEYAFQLLEHAFLPRTTVQTPFRWSGGDEWKNLIFTAQKDFLPPEEEADWLKRKESYRELKKEGKR